MQEVMETSNKIVVCLLLCLPVFCGSSCPSVCLCSPTHATCKNSTLTEIIDNIPSEINGLDYSFNRLYEVPNEIFVQKRLWNLEDLNLDWNRNVKLYRNSFKGLDKLKWLYVAGNNIKVINPLLLQYNPVIEKLTISGNPLRLPPDGPFVVSPSMKDLWMSGCHLTSVPVKAFSELPNLELLSMDGNSLQALPENLFENLKKLKRLYLNHNRLKVIQVETFEPLTNIEYIRLHSNLLKFLPSQIANKTNLVDLTLYGNILDCNCKLLETWWTITLNSVRAGKVNCAKPVANVSWDDVFTDIDCSGNSTSTEEGKEICIVWGDEGC